MKSTSMALILGLVAMGAAHAAPVFGTYDNVISQPVDWVPITGSPADFMTERLVGALWAVEAPTSIDNTHVDAYDSWLIDINDYTGQYTTWDIQWWSTLGWVQLSNMPDDPWYSPSDPKGQWTYFGNIVDINLTVDYSEYYLPEPDWSNGLEVAGHAELTAQITALFEGPGDPFYATFELSFSGTPITNWGGTPWYMPPTYRNLTGYYGPLDSASLTLESAVVPEPASMTLVGLGVAALAFKAARKRSRAE
ncbi:MAG TPA: PEP-CTERM sorting domain-containing protein [Candidatus Hydrogenedentes bacterium]|nr:PEP-CTERM sorting domain-containing protein [Candidatus Hydrogenedentota bacterium]